MDELARLAELLKAKNAIDTIIAAQIGRAAEKGHVGEYIAARIFGIQLEKGASHKASDGCFTEGQRAGRTVNIKWYAKHEGVLDLPSSPSPATLPDDYLVLAGPKAKAIATHGPVRPWVITSAYLFDARQLVGELQARGARMGIATSVKKDQWDRAEIYPAQINQRLPLTTGQRALLALFSPLNS
jgi:hypothetical protein